jgi:CRP-like cAMP-binding protein
MPEWLLPLATEAAEKMLRDPMARVRLAGVTTLGNVGGPLARVRLLSALADDNRHVREAVAVKLQALGAEALPDLEAALARADGEARRQEALSIILARIDRARFAPLIEEHIMNNLRAGHETLGALAALAQLPSGAGVAMLEASLQDCNDRRLTRIFDLIGALQPPKAVEVVVQHLHSPSARARANAVEALESLTVPQTARLVAPLVELPETTQEWSAALALGQSAWGLAPVTPDQVLRNCSRSDDPWLRAVTVYAMGEVGATLFEQQELVQIVRAGCDVAAPALVREASCMAWARLNACDEYGRTNEREEDVMLSVIERVIFLKEVPFFESMTIEQLRGLAGASEERTFDEDQQVFAEGDPGDALYVVIRGRVGIERSGVRPGAVVRLATLSSRQYFGEMSIFDGAPRSASAVALEPTLLLSLRRAPLLALARENPDLSLALIQVLSQRLRAANRQISARSKGRSRQLEKLYDKLGRE